MEGHSLAAQERLFYELCKSRGWEPVRVYREEGKSAHVDAISRRPVFRKLIEDASKRQFDVVVVHTLDRWARNMRVSLEALGILEKYQVGLASITEKLDWSSPMGRMTANMLGVLAQFYSESLGAHVSKGLDQRAYEGKHTGGIPFGYESCWAEGERGEKVRQCDPEHPGGVHIHSTEGPAVKELFTRYASGTTSLSQLASWLNESGLRTRNTRKLLDANGDYAAGPRLLTTASVRGILHNVFYTGKIVHRGKVLPGVHEAIVSEELFEAVQAAMKRNNGRSETLSQRPEREYLLKGIIRCAYCGMPMWAQTFHNGRSYYREEKGSRSHGICASGPKSITCHIVDDQIRKLISSMELKEQWLEEVLSIISLKDEAERVKKERADTQQKLKRLGKIYYDNLVTDEDYSRQKRLLEMHLESLVLPGVDAAEEAGKLILNLRELWEKANMSEQRRLLLTMLDAVYVETKKTNAVVAVKPKPPFKPIFQVAATREGSGIRIVNEPYKNSSVFLVETGESRTPRPEEATQSILQA